MQATRSNLVRSVRNYKGLTSCRGNTASRLQGRAMSTSDLKIENTNVNTAPGVTLSPEQKTVVGSVLDLFAGRPSLAKFQLWTDDAEFQDPLTIAKGRDRYQAQFYGLQTAFSEIERLSHEVTDAGNPILMNMKTRYVVKGINKEQTISSIIAIGTSPDGKITKLEDRWDGKLPDGTISNVSLTQLLSPFWWLFYVEAWAFWLWSFVWETSLWRAFRHLNAVTVPHLVSVPKNAEEDAKKGNA